MFQYLPMLTLLINTAPLPHSCNLLMVINKPFAGGDCISVKAHLHVYKGVLWFALNVEVALVYGWTHRRRSHWSPFPQATKVRTGVGGRGGGEKRGERGERNGAGGGEKREKGEIKGRGRGMREKGEGDKGEEKGRGKR